MDDLRKRLIDRLEKLLDEQAVEHGDWIDERWVSAASWDKGTVYLPFDGNIPLEKFADAMIEEMKKVKH